jgi:hypothetical protein
MRPPRAATTGSTDREMALIVPLSDGDDWRRIIPPNARDALAIPSPWKGEGQG